MTREKYPLAWRLGSDPTESLSAGSRQLAAAILRSASAALDRLAQRMEVPASAGSAEASTTATQAAQPSWLAAVEFSAEAGAPEGALYIDGRLVGWLHGVNRL